MEVITVHEYETIPSPRTLSPARFRDTLLRVTAGTRSRVFGIHRSGLRASGFVGTVDVGRVRLEILPKALRSDTDARTLLFNILRLAHYHHTLEDTSLAARERQKFADALNSQQDPLLETGARILAVNPMATAPMPVSLSQSQPLTVIRVYLFLLDWLSGNGLRAIEQTVPEGLA